MKTETVTVFGAGRSGVAAANFLVATGASIRITDAAERDRLPYADSLDSAVETFFGSHPEALLDGTDYIVLSPGIPAEIDILETARGRAIPIISEIELAFRHLRGRVIAITGSNGKSTTTSLIGHLLDRGGLDPIVAGNIGKPLTSVIDAERDRTYVIELSSFQLETVDRFRADIALLLNVTPDHMDRYETFEDYAAAKFRLFRGQTGNDLAIVNGEDETALAAATSGRRWLFSSEKPERPGAWLESGELVLDVGEGEARIPRAALAMDGDANVENALAAWLAVTSLGLDVETVRDGFSSFAGLPHRTESVAEIDGVRWINDSKGTNVDATVKSLRGLPEGSVILIMGGRDKGSDFTRLRDPVASVARLVLLIGEAAEKIRRSLDDAGPELRVVSDLESAVAVASSESRRGDVVLLSPACASFDQYRDFEQRGEHFIELVGKLEGAA